jgi:hypothetical protein
MRDREHLSKSIERELRDRGAIFEARPPNSRSTHRIFGSKDSIFESKDSIFESKASSVESTELFAVSRPSIE